MQKGKKERVTLVRGFRVFKKYQGYFCNCISMKKNVKVQKETPGMRWTITEIKNLWATTYTPNIK